MWEGLSPGKLLCGRNREWTTSWCCWNVSAETANGDLLCYLSWCICMKGKITFPRNTSGFVAWQSAALCADRCFQGLFLSAHFRWTLQCQVLLADYWIDAYQRNTRQFPGGNKCDLWWKKNGIPSLSLPLKLEIFTEIEPFPGNSAAKPCSEGF